MKRVYKNTSELSAKEAARITKMACASGETTRRLELRRAAHQEMKDVTFPKILQAARGEKYTLFYYFIHPDLAVRKEIISQLESLGYKCEPCLVIGPANYIQTIKIHWTP